MSGPQLEITGVEWPNRLLGQVADLTESPAKPVSEDGGWICRLDLETHIDADTATSIQRHLIDGELINATAELATARRDQEHDSQLPLIAAALAPVAKPGEGSGASRLPHIRAEFFTDYGPLPPSEHSIRFVLELGTESAPSAGLETALAEYRNATTENFDAKTLAILLAFLNDPPEPGE